jgi:DNA-binding response OmpR family regulator
MEMRVYKLLLKSTGPDHQRCYDAGKDGFELCRLLKTDIQTSHIPIILLTGRGDHAAMMEGIQQGADAYVVKPFDPSELLLRVKKLWSLEPT